MDPFILFLLDECRPAGDLEVPGLAEFLLWPSDHESHMAPGLLLEATLNNKRKFQAHFIPGKMRMKDDAWKLIEVVV
jgi:hypothetical protein